MLETINTINKDADRNEAIGNLILERIQKQNLIL